MKAICAILLSFLLSVFSYATDITVNVHGYKVNHPSIPGEGIIGVICYNYTTSQTVSVVNIPISSKPITISCAEHGWVGSPGDLARIAVVGDPDTYSGATGKLIAYATGLGNIDRTECRNNLTLDLKTYSVSASDVMDCEGINLGITSTITGAPNIAAGSRVAVAFNGEVIDNDDICPCFSTNRLDLDRDFAGPNNPPVCEDTSDEAFSVGGSVRAIYPESLYSSGGEISVNHTATSSGGVCGAYGSLIHDSWKNLSVNQMKACKNIITARCSPP